MVRAKGVIAAELATESMQWGTRVARPSRSELGDTVQFWFARTRAAWHHGGDVAGDGFDFGT